MKKIFKMRLFLLATLVGLSLNAIAGTYTYDFTSNENWVTTSGGSTNPGLYSANVIETIYDKTTNHAFTNANGEIYFSNGYIMVKNGAKLNVPSYSGEKITQIVIYNSTGCSQKTKVTIMSGTNTAAAVQTFSSAGSSYTYTIADDYQTADLALSVSSANCQITQIVVTTVAAGATLAKTPSLSETATSSGFSVTITNEEGSGTTYYTTNGNAPTTSSASFTGTSQTITVSSATTVKAMTVATGKQNSNVVSKSYALNIAGYKSFASGTTAVLKLTDAVVTYANGSDHYIQDATGGLDLYGSKLTYEVGNVLNGTLTGSYTLYYGTPEVAEGATYNVTTTTGGSVTPQVVTVSQLTGDNKANYACLKVTLENVSYADGFLVDEEGNTITLYDKANLLSDYAWADKVNFTGVFCNYTTTTKATPEVLPTSASEIVIVAGKASPTNIWHITAYKGSSSNVYPIFKTNSDGTKTYTSSATDAATISSTGQVTLVNAGTTTISCYTPVTDNYKASQTVSYILQVDIAGIKDTINFDGSALPDGWAKSNGMYMSSTGRYFTDAPSLGMSGASTPVTLTSSTYFNVLAISFNGNTTSAGNGKKIALKYSTDSITWNVLDSIAITYNADGMQQYIVSTTAINKINTLGNVYLQFYSGFNTAYLDDIIITYTESPNILAPIFSQEGGIKEETISLTLTNPNTYDGDYEIYYTTDGTDPRTSGTKQVYNGALNISKTTTITAYTYYLSPDAYEFKSRVASANYVFPTGRGTFENPYTVADVIMLNNARTDTCWVTGVITEGYAALVSETNETGILDKDTAIVSNIVLSEDGNINVVNIPIKFAYNPIRNWVNITENPNNTGETVKIYGKLGSYYSRPGVTATIKAVLKGHTYTNVWGDVNADGVRDLTDINALVNILTGETDNTGGMSDVNGDRVATLKDLTTLIKNMLPKQ